jgi:hypothetical protein
MPSVRFPTDAARPTSIINYTFSSKSQRMGAKAAGSAAGVKRHEKRQRDQSSSPSPR